VSQKNGTRADATEQTNDAPAAAAMSQRARFRLTVREAREETLDPDR
jgi:hypothetical protein